MAICPFATVKLLPASSPSHSTQRITATQIIAHSIGDAGATAQNLYDFWSGAGSDGNSSHFFVTKGGGVWQFVDTAYECYASLNANRRSDGTGAIAFESEDVGDPDTEPWTPAAVAAITRLCLWLIQVHPGIAKRECRTPVDPGLGYHSMWGYNTAADPTRNPWTRARGKTCPGLARIPQWRHTIVPAVLTGQPVPTPVPTPSNGDPMLIVFTHASTTQKYAGGIGFGWQHVSDDYARWLVDDKQAVDGGLIDEPHAVARATMYRTLLPIEAPEPTEPTPAPTPGA